MNSEVTLSALLLAALLGGVIHTIAGPDHYLPFVAIAQSRNFSIAKTWAWTILCGVGHIGSALLIAGVFLIFAEFLSASHLSFIEEWRGNIAAYGLIGMGIAIILFGLRNRSKSQAHKHRHCHADGESHSHEHDHDCQHGHFHENNKKLSYWIIFILFIFGPCEALLPLLTASMVLGARSVLLVATVFSLFTIMTMLAAVTAGFYGVKRLRLHWLERFSSEVAGATVMLCGLAIVCLGW